MWGELMKENREKAILSVVGGKKALLLRRGRNYT